MCPYFNDGPTTWCNISGASHDDYQKNDYCKSSSNWRRCANYEKASYETRMQKQVRSNPDI